MTATWLRIARWGIRLVVAFGLYAAVVQYWENNAVGWDKLGVFAGGIMFGIAAAAAWCASIIIEHFFVANAPLRLAAHPLVTTGFFALFGWIVIGVYMDNTVADTWRDGKPFGLLVAVCALIDACAGLLLARWLAPAPHEPT